PVCVYDPSEIYKDHIAHHGEAIDAPAAPRQRCRRHRGHGDGIGEGNLYRMGEAADTADRALHAHGKVIWLTNPWIGGGPEIETERGAVEERVHVIARRHAYGVSPRGGRVKGTPRAIA